MEKVSQYVPGADPEAAPVYVLTKDGIKSVSDGEESLDQPQKRKYLLGSPWLSFSLVLALLAYFFNDSAWVRAVEESLERRQNLVAYEPYRIWVRNNPMSYGDVAAGPEGFVGKAVIWSVQFDSEGRCYAEGNPAMPVYWTNLGKGIRLTTQDNGPVRVLARIEGSKDEFPILMFLEAY